MVSMSNVACGYPGFGYDITDITSNSILSICCLIQGISNAKLAEFTTLCLEFFAHQLMLLRGLPRVWFGVLVLAEAVQNKANYEGTKCSFILFQRPRPRMSKVVPIQVPEDRTVMDKLSFAPSTRSPISSSKPSATVSTLRARTLWIRNATRHDNTWKYRVYI